MNETRRPDERPATTKGSVEAEDDQVETIAFWNRQVDNAVRRYLAAREGRGYRFIAPEIRHA
jgi:hypothetical protein